MIPVGLGTGIILGSLYNGFNFSGSFLTFEGEEKSPKMYVIIVNM